MSARERVIEEILERYWDLVDPHQSRSGVGDGVHLPLCPPTYTPSVREVERLLGSLRDSRRDLWWHVDRIYITAVTVTRDVSVRRKVRGGKTHVEVERRAIRVPDARASKNTASEGIAWMAQHWALPSEPFLPREMCAA